MPGAAAWAMPGATSKPRCRRGASDHRRQPGRGRRVDPSDETGAGRRLAVPLRHATRREQIGVDAAQRLVRVRTGCGRVGRRFGAAAARSATRPRTSIPNATLRNRSACAREHYWPANERHFASVSRSAPIVLAAWFRPSWVPTPRIASVAGSRLGHALEYGCAWSRRCTTATESEDRVRHGLELGDGR